MGRTGATVLVGARNREAGEEAAAALASEGIDARFIELDIAVYTSIDGAAGSITDGFGRLDILVNNAGINDPADGPVPTARLDAVERVLRTNFLGALAVTQAVLPLLRKLRAARIVNLSSGLGSLTQNGDLLYPYAAAKLIGYSASKAALNMLTVRLPTCFGTRPLRSIRPIPAIPQRTSTAIAAHRLFLKELPKPSILPFSQTTVPPARTPIARASCPGRRREVTFSRARRDPAKTALPRGSLQATGRYCLSSRPGRVARAYSDR